MKAFKLKRVRQCAKCPWKKSTNPREIPNELARSGTVRPKGRLDRAEGRPTTYKDDWQMARVRNPTPKQEKAWNKWVAGLPEVVRVIAVRFDPWSLYRMKSTGHRVTVYSFSEDGTMTVNVTGEFNLLTHDRRVFGIEPDDLESCDPPEPYELLGAALSQEQVWDNLDSLRVMIRPDLWVMDENGIARRRDN